MTSVILISPVAFHAKTVFVTLPIFFVSGGTKWQVFHNKEILCGM